MKVSVIGAAGYVGNELLRILLQHPDVTELTATSRSQAGKPIADLHPSLGLLTDARFSGDSPAEAARKRDVVFLALEHGESSRVMADVLEAGPQLIVDLAADFRIRDGRQHARYYGEHPAPALVHHFRYGLADVMHEDLRGARAIAAPGCFATAAQLALHAIADVPLAAPPVIFAVTGSSGAGQNPKPTTHHPARAHNMFAYPSMPHRHEGEILEQWRAWRGDDAATARLIPHSGPFVRGIYATLHARIGAGHATVRVGHAQVRAGHAPPLPTRPFMRFIDSPPELTAVIGTNLALLHVATSEDGTEITVTCAIDNLIKGAGGQAVQAMNIALGLRETAGLTSPAIYPC